MPKFPKFYFKPSLVLGLLFWGEVLAFLLVANWIAGESPVVYLPVAPPAFDAQKWILMAGAMAAMMGWTVSAYISVKNSIKQHTINTLLQSRLSETYMKRAKEVSDHFAEPSGALIPVRAEEIGKTETFEKLEALRYVLNYFEFISVGIRHGDLHEGLLKGSLRGMLCSVYEVAEEFVKDKRNSNPKAWEHLDWTYRRWKIKAPTSSETISKLSPEAIRKNPASS